MASGGLEASAQYAPLTMNLPSSMTPIPKLDPVRYAFTSLFNTGPSTLWARGSK